jgi:hypothetical protein
MGCTSSKPVASNKLTAVAPRQSSPTQDSTGGKAGRVESGLCIDGEGICRMAPQSKATLTRELETSSVEQIQTKKKDFALSDATFTLPHSLRKRSKLCALLTLLLHAITIFIGEFVLYDRTSVLNESTLPVSRHLIDASDETDLILNDSLLNNKRELMEKERLAAMKRYAESIGLSQPSSSPHVVPYPQWKVHRKRSKT